VSSHRPLITGSGWIPGMSTGNLWWTEWHWAGFKT